MTIAQRIKLYRQQKGFSQNELAQLSKVNNKSLSRYELGTSIVPANALKNISDALGISADALLSDIK
jgi:transcriptional regulator with XRE-family HTH domain